jgi:dynactin 1
MASFQLDDAVHVSRESRQLEGVVAYLGPVDFGDGDDWVGVRLTGAAVGLGKNDGTVQGRSYFVCPPQCGVFVRHAALTKRPLSALERLRLKRELAGVAKPPAPHPSTPPLRRTPTRRSGTAPTTSPTSTSTTGSPTANNDSVPSPRASALPRRDRTPTTAASTRSKLEELRQRRAALQEKKNEDATPAAMTSSTTGPMDRSIASDAGTAQIAQIQAQLDQKTTEATRLQQTIDAMRNQAQASQVKIEQLEIAVANANAAAAEATASAPQTDTNTNPVVREVVTPAVQEQILHLQRDKDTLQDQVDNALRELSNIRTDLDREKSAHATAVDQLTAVRSQATALEHTLQTQSAQTTQRNTSDATHFKERAKLQTEVSGWKRKVAQLELEKQELDNTIEDLTLDKEGLLEEKEALQDKLEEYRLDMETAQMEVEELKMELEDAQTATERAVQGDSVPVATAETSAEADANEQAERKAHALATQNARLREALIRLREQTTMEKMEITKTLRAAEKQALEGKSLMEEIEALRATKSKNDEEINDLKDMVEEGAAFESMVEDLSDRILALEEDNIAMQGTIRELEEASELTAEMEEVQNDELKALYRDLEGRDTIIRNLEEAIKMQRRREEDSRRSVANYRTTVDTLKQEKQALLELQQGGEGEKSDLMVSSQRALSRAAQLVSDAAEMRKREAQAVFEKIDRQLYFNLSSRLESLLPPSVVAPELSAMKGELLTSKVIGKGSRTLEGIDASFRKVIKPALGELDEVRAGYVPGMLQLSDEVKQDVATMIHQTDFAHSIVNASSYLLRLLAAGQWPDLLSQNASVELGSVLGNCVADLDNSLGVVLKTLKEEGTLAPDQSDVAGFRQSADMVIQSIQTEMDREDTPLVPVGWMPPAWKLLTEATTAKYSCIGAAAALSTVVNQSDTIVLPQALASLYNKLEQVSIQARSVCLRLANVDVTNTEVVTDLSASMSHWVESSDKMIKEVQSLITSEGSHLEECQAACDSTLGHLTKISSSLRSANLNPNDDESFHALSPEVEDSWFRLTTLIRSVRSKDGDDEDVNFLLRTRAIETQFDEAVADVPKLSLASAKAANLEKSISIRSKEVAMLNARLSELERLLAKSNVSPSKAKTTDLKSVDEYSSMKEENRVLLEAMDVLQRQVDEYENEIRALKDFKSPKRGAVNNRTPRRSLTSVNDMSSSQRNLGDDSQGSAHVLEAALFRPALQQAIREAARWKTSSTLTMLSSLPPLPAISSNQFQTNLSSSRFQELNEISHLSLALSAFRLEKASVSLVDLTKQGVPPRMQLRNLNARKAAASERLETIILRCRGQLCT